MIHSMRSRRPSVAGFADFFRTRRRGKAAGARQRSSTRPPPVGNRESVLSSEDIEHRRAVQQLEQEQKAFELQTAQSEADFRLQRAMGWTTFAVVFLSGAFALIEPLTLTAFGPISALALWNWRRLLKEPRELKPTTRSPASNSAWPATSHEQGPRSTSE